MNVCLERGEKTIPLLELHDAYFALMMMIVIIYRNYICMNFHTNQPNKPPTPPPIDVDIVIEMLSTITATVGGCPEHAVKYIFSI